MTDIAITDRKSSIADAIREAFTRLKDWLNEEVYAGPAASEFESRDWADLPTFHPKFQSASSYAQHGGGGTRSVTEGAPHKPDSVQAAPPPSPDGATSPTHSRRGGAD